MVKTKQSSRRKKFDYNKDRKKMKTQLRKKHRPRIDDSHIRNAWSDYKSSSMNLQDMGLACDPKHILPITTKQSFSKGKGKKATAPVVIKPYVVRQMEAEANLPYDDDKTLSNDLISYVQHMVREHGEDYKAMARDEQNYYQDTPNQIRRKVNEYKRCHAAHFAAFMRSLQTAKQAPPS